MDQITSKEFKGIFEEIAVTIDNNKDYLTKMDAEMGDGDLGLTMSKGFSKVSDFLKDFNDDDLGVLMFQAGRTMAATVPSTMGTLMGSGMMEAGKKLKGLKDLKAENLQLIYEGMYEGIKKRGKCTEGERTVLDAFSEALSSFNAVDENSGKTLLEAAESAFEGAQRGVEKTKDMVPQYGKAVVHSAKALGRIDQGAYVGQLFAEGVYKYIAEN